VVDRIRVALADSNRLIRVGLEVVLSKESDIVISGEAGSYSELQDLLSNEEIDVVLMDFTSEGFSLETILELAKSHPRVKIVAITSDQEAHTITNALKAGVSSYVKKTCDFNEIISSVRETAAGARFFCGTILETIQRVDIDPDSSVEEFNCEPVQLSAREQEIIALIAEGLTNTQIAERLYLSPHTVNTHRKNIMQKLGVKNTASIVMYAVKTNLINVNKFLFSSP
jgi:DNA-binding NarL/FixJ family response regulator